MFWSTNRKESASESDRGNVLLVIGPDNPGQTFMAEEAKYVKGHWRKLNRRYSVLGNGKSPLDLSEIQTAANSQPGNMLVVIHAHGNAFPQGHMLDLGGEYLTPTMRLLKTFGKRTDGRKIDYLVMSCAAGVLHSEIENDTDALPKGTKVGTLTENDELLGGTFTRYFLRDFAEDRYKYKPSIFSSKVPMRETAPSVEQALFEWMIDKNVFASTPEFCIVGEKHINFRDIYQNCVGKPFSPEDKQKIKSVLSPRLMMATDLDDEIARVETNRIKPFSSSKQRPNLEDDYQMALMVCAAAHELSDCLLPIASRKSGHLPQIA